MNGFRQWNMFLCGLIIVVDFTTFTLGLKCFFCAGTGNDMPCLKQDPYLRSADCSTAEYRKNCSSPYDPMCTIETHYSPGGPLMQIRDCNDGKSKFYPPKNGSNTPDMYVRLNNLDPRNNETECVWDGKLKILVCFSKCNGTDFCNGPQLDIKTCGSSSPLAPAYMCLIFAGIIIVEMFR